VGGVAFFFVLFWDSNGPLSLNKLSMIDSDKEGWSLAEKIILVFIMGAFLHALQRGICQIPIDLMRGWILKWKWFAWLREIIFPEKALNHTVKRLERQSVEKMCDHLYSWGASAHSLYTVGVALWAAYFFSHNLGSPANTIHHVHAHSLIWISVVFFVAGFISDCRKGILEDKLLHHRFVVSNSANAD
jgi:hypothetical protein